MQSSTSFELDFTDEDIREALGYCGSREDGDRRIRKLMSVCAEEVKKAARPKSVYRLFSVIQEEEGVLLSEGDLRFPGRDIKQHLEGCPECILLAVTLSSGIDELIRKQEVSDLAMALCTDTLASVAVEKYCRYMGEKICGQMKDTYATYRFSPGYGDLPLTVQPKLLNVLNAGKTAGIVLQKENMMSPMKSVTAVIGISEDPVEKKRMGCAECRSFEGCSLRRKGLHCGFQKTT
jgi:5-methyltetrahydrofolate--homocysteine methyltransferase